MMSTANVSFDTPEEYFDHLTRKMGLPPLHKQFKSDSVRSDHINIHIDYRIIDRKAPTVVFIPGTGIYSMCYAEVLFKLSQEGYNIVGFDPRGHGRSGGTRGDYTINEIMADAEAVIHWAKKKTNNKVSLLGSSQGGIVAFYLASKGVEVDSVICQCFADLTDDDSVRLTRFPSLMKYVKQAILKIPDVLKDNQIPVISYLDLERIHINYFGNARNFAEQDPLVIRSISLRAIKSLANTPMPNPIEEIDIPVFVFQGNKDTIFPVDYTEKIYNKLTCKKRIHIFHDMNHALMSNNADEILPEIVDWLKEIYPDS